MSTADQLHGVEHRPGLWSRALNALTMRHCTDPRTAFDFEFKTIDGAPMALSAWRGRALFVVNTASKCGFTSQYTALQRLHESYAARGLTVIGVPSNDFGGQEPGDEAEIQAFCRSRFHVTFPLTAKTKVIGADAHPFYRWAGQTCRKSAQPRWNFHKYLIAPDGKLVDWFASVTAPTAERVTTAVERVLPG